MMLNIINHQGNANQNHNEAKTALSMQGAHIQSLVRKLDPHAAMKIKCSACCN